MSNVSLSGKPLACLEDCLDESSFPRLVDRHGILQCRYELHSPVYPTAICPYSMRLAEFRGVLSISPEWNHNDRPTENLWKGKGWPIEI